MKETGLFAGLKVLDITTAGTGPLAAGFLADYGATVVLIESKTRPNLNRVSAPYRGGVPNLNTSGLMTPFCTSRYSFGLNLGLPEGREIARKLAVSSDIVVSSYSPGVMERWGLGYSEISKVKPDIIMLGVSLEGQTGPRSSLPGFGFNMKGLSGLVHFTGWPDRDGCGVPMAYADTTTPWLAAIALLCALEYRDNTGKGQYIDFSQLEASLNFTPAYYLLDFAVNGRIASRQGNYSPYAAPHGVYPCLGDDNWVAIAAGSDEEWDSLCKVMGEPSWTKEPHFATFLLRQSNLEELDLHISKWTAEQKAEVVMDKMQAAGVPCGKVQNSQDVLDNDPQLRHREYFKMIDHAGVGNVAYHSYPAKLSKGSPEIGPTPMLGEHTEFVAKEILGMSDEQFVELLSKGVLEMEL